MGRMPALSAGPGLTAFATAGFDIGFEAAPTCCGGLGGLMFGVDAAGASRHRAFRIGVPARFPAGRPAAPHGGKAAMAGSHALRGFPFLLEWESRMEEGWRQEIPHPQGFPPCRDLLWQRAAGSPASVGFSPIRATAGSAGRRKPHTRRGAVHFRAFAWRGKPRIRRRFSNPRNIQSLNPKEAPQPAVFFPESPFKVGEGLQETPPCKGSPYLLAKPFSVFLLMDSTGSPPYLLTKRSRP